MTADQQDFDSYYRNLITKQSVNRINCLRTAFTRGQAYGDVERDGFSAFQACMGSANQPPEC